MSSIVVSNLPTVLFSQPSDIEPLLMPFGDVKKIERLPSVAGSASAYSGLFSIMVTYASPESAREARDTLHGQVYGNQALFVEISGGPGGQVDRLSDVHRSTAPPGLQQNQQKWSSNPTKSPSAFNPRASPFAFDYNSFASHNSAPPTCTIASPRLDYFESFVSNNNFSNSNNGHINYSENSLPPSLSYAKPHAPSTMSTGLAIPSETYQPQPQPLSTVSNVDWSLSSNTSRAPFLNPSQSASQYPLRSTSAASWCFTFFLVPRLFLTFRICSHGLGGALLVRTPVLLCEGSTPVNMEKIDLSSPDKRFTAHSLLDHLSVRNASDFGFASLLASSIVRFKSHFRLQYLVHRPSLQPLQHSPCPVLCSLSSKSRSHSNRIASLSHAIVPPQPSSPSKVGLNPLPSFFSFLLLSECIFNDRHDLAHIYLSFYSFRHLSA